MPKYSDPTTLNQISTFSLLPSSTLKILSPSYPPYNRIQTHNLFAEIQVSNTTIMSVDLTVDRLEVVALREKVAVMAEENKFVNDQNDDLIERNGELAIENEDLKKKLALAEERQQKYFDFWRSAEEELTQQIELNDELKKQLEAAKAEVASVQEASK
ncbi:hypothetical protein FACUT_10864 [Fusarium acutatum]|uniref:Uncharacterized protein n=1 Tax=Fusarium acutatum TaxID=78861 RepID=A0A8H4JE78_9HYPO|nr:hypothetical protein FACUT_10864 [Fusarium acutatum]